MTNSYLTVGHSSESVEWPTPPWVVEQAAREFGAFNLDPAATAESAKAPRFFTEADDGLAHPWFGKVWMNPPYGRTIGKWMAKAHQEVKVGRAEIVVCLVPVRVDARWWQNYVIHARCPDRSCKQPAPLLRFWPQRLEYTPGVSSPFASATVVYGRLPGRRHGTVPAKCPVCRQVFWPAYRNRVFCSDLCRVGHNRTGLLRIQESQLLRIQAPIRNSNDGPIRNIASALPSADQAHLIELLELIRDNPGQAQLVAHDYLRERAEA